MTAKKPTPLSKGPGRPPELTDAKRTTVWLDRESREIAYSHGDMSATIRIALKKLGRNRSASNRQESIGTP